MIRRNPWIIPQPTYTPTLTKADKFDTYPQAHEPLPLRIDIAGHTNLAKPTFTISLIKLDARTCTWIIIKVSVKVMVQ